MSLITNRIWGEDCRVVVERSECGDGVLVLAEGNEAVPTAHSSPSRVYLT